MFKGLMHFKGLHHEAEFLGAFLDSVYNKDQKTMGILV